MAVDNSRHHELAVRIDDLRVFWRLQRIAADFGNLPILNKDGAVFDRAVRDGQDRRVLNEDNWGRFRGRHRTRLRRKEMRRDRSGKNRCYNRENYAQALVHRGLLTFASTSAAIDFSFGFAPVKSMSTPTLAT